MSYHPHSCRLLRRCSTYAIVCAIASYISYIESLRDCRHICSLDAGRLFFHILLFLPFQHSHMQADDETTRDDCTCVLPQLPYELRSRQTCRPRLRVPPVL